MIEDDKVDRLVILAGKGSEMDSITYWEGSIFELVGVMSTFLAGIQDNMLNE